MSRRKRPPLLMLTVATVIVIGGIVAGCVGHWPGR